MAITAIAAIPGGQGLCAQEPAPAAESAPAAATTVVPSAPAIRPQEPAWELRPYRVTVELTVSPSSAITDSVRRISQRASQPVSRMISGPCGP